MKITTPSLLIAVALACAGCSDQQRLDGSTPAALEASMERVRQALPEEQQPAFDQALQEIILENISYSAIISDFEAALGSVSERLDGKTYEDIFSEAEQLREKRRRQEIAQAMGEIDDINAEIDEIERLQEQAELAKTEIERLEVDRARFYYSKGLYSSNPTIEIRVANNTEYAISRAYFNAVIRSPNRTIPWAEERFNYSIPGGLEPGETAEWTLSPNLFSGSWGQVPKDRDDIIMIATPYRLDGPSGEKLFDLEETESLNTRKRQLQSRVEELQTIL